MELRHLRYFVLVAEELHFGRAAKRAGIAQPPLSQQIRSLEADLGVRLFDRTKRRVDLTDAGRALLPEARETLRRAERAEQRARDGALGLTGTLSVGFVGSLAFGFLPRFIRAYRAQVERVRLELRELTSEQQRQAIRENTLDLGFVRYPLPDAELSVTALSTEPLLVAIPSDHELAADPDPVRVDALAGEPLLIFPRQYGPPFFDQVMGLCRDAGFTPEIVQEAIQMPTIVSLVDAGIGVAIVPGSISRMRLAGVTLRRLLDRDGNAAETAVYMIRRAELDSSVIGMATSIAQDVAGAD